MVTLGTWTDLKRFGRDKLQEYDFLPFPAEPPPPRG
jgi:hypothetical protein